MSGYRNSGILPNAPHFLTVLSQPATTSRPSKSTSRPKGGCTEAVVKEIAAARSTVLVQAYSFTSVPIAKALVDAHKRGVDVQAVLDKSQRTEKYSSADFLVNIGVLQKNLVPVCEPQRGDPGGEETVPRVQSVGGSRHGYGRFGQNP